MIFFTVFKEYEKTSQYLNLGCYHICQNLSEKDVFSFQKVAVCKIIKDNFVYIRSNNLKIWKIFYMNFIRFKNQYLFINYNKRIGKYGNQQKILRIIYENLLFKYRNIILKDERGFKGLLNQFFTQDISQRQIISQQIVQILRVNSRFQDQERYFIDFKQKFQEFVRKNIEEHYKKSILHQDYDYYLIIYGYRLASRLLNYPIFFEMQSAQFHLENELEILEQIKQICGEKKLKKFTQMISEMKELLFQKSIIVFEEYFSDIILINKKKWPVLHDNDQKVFQQLNTKKRLILKTISNRKLRNQITVAFSTILFLYDYNDDPKTLNEITEQLKLEKDQILFQLDRMVTFNIYLGQIKILWNDGDSYFLNDSQIQQEVKENLIVMDHNIYEKSNQINQIKTFYDKTQDIKYQLDAFIIKNLKKGEKQMNHDNLLEIIQKHFYPTPVNNEKLKESLDFLIKYDYISRKDKEISVYLYK